MIREIVEPQSEKYILDIPKEYINKKIEILVFPLDLDIDESSKKVIDFSRYKVNAFKHIDPLKWQHEIRSEWERDFD